MKRIALLCATVCFSVPAQAATLMYDNFSGPVADATGQFPTLGSYAWVCSAPPGNNANPHCLRGGGRLAADSPAAGTNYYHMQTPLTPLEITYQFKDTVEAPTFVIAVSRDGTLANMWHANGFNIGSSFLMPQTYWCDTRAGCSSTLVNVAPAFETQSGACAATVANRSYIGSLSFYGITAISTLKDAGTGEVLCTNVTSDPRLPQLIGPHFYVESYYYAPNVEVNFLQADDTPSVRSLSQFVPAGSGTVRAVAAAIDVSLRNQSGYAFSPLFDLSAAAMPAALAELSGEIGSLSAEAGIAASRSFLALMMNPSVTAGGVASAASPAHRRGDFEAGKLDVWISAYGEQNSGDADIASGAHNENQNQVGMAVGFDYRPNREFAVGLALGTSRQNWGLPDLTSTGRANVVQTGIYASRHGSRGYAQLGLTYSRFAMKTLRTTSVVGAGQYAGSFDADVFGGRFELGTRVWGRGAQFAVLPFAAVEEQHFYAPASTEKAVLGSTAYALDFIDLGKDQYFTDIGLKIDSNAGAKIEMHASLAWRHVFVPAQAATAEFATSPGTAFTVSSARTGPELAVSSIGAEMHLTRSLFFGVTFNSAIGRSSSSYGGLATLRRSW